MNTTSTGGNGKKFEATIEYRMRKTDLKAALSLFRLFDHEVDSFAWTEIIRCFRDLKSMSLLETSIISIFNEMPLALPSILLRRDRGLWESSVYFEHAGKVFYISFDQNDNIQARMKGAGIDIKSETYVDGDEVDFVINEIIDYLASGRAEEIGAETFFALWVSRGYDTLQNVSIFRMLCNKYAGRVSAKVAVLLTGNLIDARKFFPFISRFETIDAPGSWRKALPISTNLAESLKLDWKHQNDFHKEMISIIRAMGNGEQEIPPTSGDGRFNVFISIEAEKRQAINQLNLFSEILRRLSGRHKINVFVNGMTGNIEGADEFSAVKLFEEDIIQKLRSFFPTVGFLHMHGWTFEEKAKKCSELHFHISPLGTAMLIPLCLNVPGIVYNSPAMMSQFLWLLKVMPSRTKPVPLDWVSASDQDLAINKYAWGHSDNSRTSYFVDVEKIADMVDVEFDAALKPEGGNE